MNSIKRATSRLLKRFARSQRGNVAMIAGIALPVLLMISAGAIDLHHAAKVKSELQDALDAATLAAARSSYTAPADIQRVGMASIRANMPKYFKDNPADVATFTLASRYQIQATATVQVKTIIANVFLPPYGKLFDDHLPMSASSDVLRASRNVEVAMALDITGSMDRYMDDLRGAAKELVGIVVQGDQEIFQTRVALIPYAAGVNAGTWADAMRGSALPKTNVTKAGWADPAVNFASTTTSTSFVTSNNHGLSAGDTVYLTGFRTSSSGGVSSINNRAHTVRAVTSNTRFTINSSVNNNIVAAASGETRQMRRCFKSDCSTVITSVNHHIDTNEYVTISGVSGVTGVNGTFKATKLNANEFTIPLNRPSGNFSGTSGRVECHGDGCEVRKYDNPNGTVRTLNMSDCVSERPYASGSSRPSDARPSDSARSNLVGRVYPHSGNPCPAPTITPLSNTVRGTGNLNTIIDGYVSGGSTAGQIGIEQAWYAISPTYGAIFPAANRPNEFDTSKTVKAVVLMTDGEFNTPYCQGVISQDAVDNGNAGEASYQINCGSVNGNLFEQSVRTCDAMKAQGIVVYTVGFNLQVAQVNSVTDTAYEVMYRCASDPRENFFPTTSGKDMKEAFKQIGRDITRLRIAR